MTDKTVEYELRVVVQGREGLSGLEQDYSKVKDSAEGLGRTGAETGAALDKLQGLSLIHI